MARHLIEPNIEKKKKVQLLNLWKVNDCSPYKSSFANGSYFCMTLCVAIATVATQEREKKGLFKRLIGHTVLVALLMHSQKNP